VISSIDRYRITHHAFHYQHLLSNFSTTHTVLQLHFGMLFKFLLIVEPPLGMIAPARIK
jgi:cytochrome b subunit of formate dehydrogenase